MPVFQIQNEAGLVDLAKEIIRLYPDKRIIALSGDLGVGKTAFVKAFAAQLDTRDEVSSPTFSLVNEYHSAKTILYHFDLYRLEKTDDILEIGFEEYLESGAYCLIEWPEKITFLLPEARTLYVKFVLLPDQSRQIILE